MFLSPLNGYVKMSPYSVSNDNFVQWGGRRFQIPPQPQRFSFAGAKVQLYESLEGKSCHLLRRYQTPSPLWITHQGVTFSRCYNTCDSCAP